MSIEKIKPSFHFEAERIEQLKQIAPEAFADGKIIWENLQEALGDFIDEENADTEHFGLFWPGKREARKIASTPSLGTLIPINGGGIEEENTKNIFIEGENLEVLKLLQKSYANRIKMIYIDPPYNTGNDFIYEDNFTESIEEYLKRTGQVDEEAKPISANTKADGRFHSKWLSMMYSRLRLARNLLKDDGVIFVSIDDNEVNNLKLLMNEVFGEENFVALVIVQTNPRGRTLDKYIAKTHEYILIYAKDVDEKGVYFINKTDKAKSGYNNVDENGNYRLLELRNRNPVFNRKNRPNLYYPIYFNEESGEVSLVQDEYFNVEVYPVNSKNEDGCWTWGQNKCNKFNDLLVGKRVGTGALRIFRKDYLTGSSEFTKAKSTWLESNFNHENGKEAITKLFGYSPFDFPKSPDLIKKCIELGTVASNEDIILDFFAGSGTTAHSVFLKNIEDNGDRRFILNQLDFPTKDNDNYSKLSEISIDRVKKSSIDVKSKVTDDYEYDFGFKTYKLQHSNYKSWKNYTGTDINELENLFENNSSPLVDGWKTENLQSEIMLLEGFPLDSSIILIDSYKQNTITQISSDFCEHKLLVCLDEKIDDNTIKTLELSDNDIFICLDNAISDKDKVTLQDKGLIKTI
jgi:adenine-specific DNA-methyltransferase